MLKTYVSERLKKLADEGVLNNFHQKDLAKNLGVSPRTIRMHLQRLKIIHSATLLLKDHILKLLKEEATKNPFLNTDEIKVLLAKKGIKKTIKHIRDKLNELVESKEVFSQNKGRTNFFTLDKNLLLKDYVDAYKYVNNLKFQREEVDEIIELAKTQSIKEIYETINHRISKSGIYYILRKNNIHEFIRNKRVKTSEAVLLSKINTLPKNDKGVYLISYRQASELFGVCPKYLAEIAKKNNLIFKGYKKRTKTSRIYKVKDPSLKIVKQKPLITRVKKENPVKVEAEIKEIKVRKIEKDKKKKESNNLGFCDFSVRNATCLNRTSREKIEVFASGGRKLCKNCMTLVGVK